MAQIEPDLVVTVSGCADEIGRELAYAVQAVVLNLTKNYPELDFRRMHRIIVTTDLGSELASLSASTASKNPLTHTNEEYGTAVAQVLVLPRGENEPEIVPVFSASIVAALIEKDQKREIAEWMFHALHHEFCHVHDDNRKLDAMPHIMLRHRCEGKDRFIQPLAEACWSEYFANYLSSATAPPMSVDSMTNSLLDAIKRTKPLVDGEILKYRTGRNLDHLMEIFGRHGEFLAKAAAYTLGYMDGLGKTLAELSPEAAECLKDSYFEPTWKLMHPALQKMRQASHDEWKTLSIYGELGVALEKYYSDMGLILSNAENGQAYVDVPLRPETTPSLFPFNLPGWIQS